MPSAADPFPSRPVPILDLLKRTAVRVLPASLLSAVRRVHHARALRAPDLRDEPDLAVVRYLVGEGDVVLDLGANVGLYTSVLSRWVGPAGAVHAVEPIPETNRTLRHVVRRLGLGNVIVHEAALSDRDGMAQMEVPRMPRGEGHYFAHLVGDRGSADDADRFAVRTATVDTLFAAQRDRVRFVKCDVEGFELGVIRGADALLRCAAPAWLIEVGGDPDASDGAAAALFAALAAYHYEAWWYDRARLRRRERGDRSVNYFFLVERHVQQLRERAPELLPPAS